MRRILVPALLLILVCIPLVPVATVHASSYQVAPPLTSQKKAVVLSSLDSLYPMGYYFTGISYELSRAGYQVTMIKNTNVTFDLLTTQLNNYDVIIWRTSEYVYHHNTYWYVGETVNSTTMQKYANDFTLGYANMNAGVMGIGLEFFNEHFPSGSLSHVKLLVILASDSMVFSNYFVAAGAKAVVAVNGYLPLEFGITDDETWGLFADLANGQTVGEAVYVTVSPYTQSEPRDPLDSNLQLPFWYMGDGSVTIT